jgi:glycosyltransferase involved in cell wall biosynthesis
MKIALVTEELAHGAGSGGIGGAFHELALLLRRSGHGVDVFYVPAQPQQASVDELQRYYAAHDIDVLPIPTDEYVWEASPENRAYAVFAHLRARPAPYDVVHFHDYKGLGHFCLAAKKQRLAFLETIFVVQVHGPTRWTLEANTHDFTHEDQLKIDFLERGSIAGADVVVSPSRYMLDWLARQGWATPAGCTHVIQNPCAKLQAIRPHTTPGNTPGATPALSGAPPRRADEIVLFARHEERKGIVEFCNALDLLADELAEAGTQVTFLGPLGTINGEPSLTWLASRARKWRFPLAIQPDFDRQAAAAYLVGNPRSLVVVPSPVENSPYTVLEAVVLGKPLLTSTEGGAPELLDAASAKKMTCRITGPDLAAAMRRTLARPLCTPRRGSQGCEYRGAARQAAPEPPRHAEGDGGHHPSRTARQAV